MFRFQYTHIYIFFSLVLFLSCSQTNSAGSGKKPDNPDGDDPTDPTTAIDCSTSEKAQLNLDCPITLDLNFVPSNIEDKLGSEYTVSGDIVFTRDRCEDVCVLNTTSGTIEGLSTQLFEENQNTSTLSYKLITQDDPGNGINAPKIAVFSARKITIEEGATVRFEGDHAGLLLASDSIDIQGILRADAKDTSGQASGFSSPSSTWARGQGPGGASAAESESTNMPSGGSHCGVGGEGSTLDLSPTKSTPAAAYGNQNVVPLLGGSSGSRAASQAGAGGGGTQLVAGNSITIKASGVVDAGGGAVGRIRINSVDAITNQNSTISPAMTTECYSEGQITELE